MSCTFKRHLTQKQVISETFYQSTWHQINQT